jgi:hypothetical protein
VRWCGQRRTRVRRRWNRPAALEPQRGSSPKHPQRRVPSPRRRRDSAREPRPRAGARGHSPREQRVRTVSQCAGDERAAGFRHARGRRTHVGVTTLDTCRQDDCVLGRTRVSGAGRIVVISRCWPHPEVDVSGWTCPVPTRRSGNVVRKAAIGSASPGSPAPGQGAAVAEVNRRNPRGRRRTEMPTGIDVLFSVSTVSVDNFRGGSCLPRPAQVLEFQSANGRRGWHGTALGTVDEGVARGR